MTVKDPVRTVIWGQPGVGKTTLAATFPNPWFIDIEKSTAWMPALKQRQWTRPRNWQEITQQIQRFKTELPGDTLVIDSIDWLEAKYIEKFGSPGGQNDYGKSYNDLDKVFRKLLDDLTEISEKGVHIVLTAHFDTKDVSDPDQLQSYSKYVLKMQKKTCSAVLEWADEVLFLRFRDTVIGTDRNGKKGKAVGGQIRDIKTMRTAAYDAKNRFDLPEEIEFKTDKALPEPLRTLLWDGYDAYLDLKGSSRTQSIATSPISTKTPNSVPSMKPAPAPIAGPVGQPQSPQVQPVQNPVPQSKIDPRLLELMQKDGVTKEQIESLVASKGWFDCPLEEYPKEFVEPMLINGWSQMLAAIKPAPEIVIDSSDLPF